LELIDCNQKKNEGRIKTGKGMSKRRTAVKRRRSKTRKKMKRKRKTRRNPLLLLSLLAHQLTFHRLDFP